MSNEMGTMIVETEKNIPSGIIECSKCEKLNKAMEVMKILQWRTPDNRISALGMDRETMTILIDEESLMRAIQLGCPGQAYRKIKLITREEYKKRKYGHMYY